MNKLWNIKAWLSGLILILLMGIPGLSHAQASAFCRIPNRILNHGEKLNFKVYYNAGFVWVPAGEANFTTRKTTLEGKPVYHVVGDGATYSSYDAFFKVRDKYQTWIDANSLLPLKFDRRVREGSYSKDNTILFNHLNNTAVSKGSTYQTAPCVQDVLSAIFYARNLDYSRYKVGDKIPFKMFLDNEIYSLYIRYLGKETIKTRYGTFKTIKLAPLLIQGTLFKGGEDMRIWVTDDQNHIPVRVNSPILVGSIKVDMMHYQNLKYPLTALVKRR